MISSKKISAIMLGISTVLSMATIIISLSFNPPGKSTGNVSITEKKAVYILKDYNGHLAVFNYGESSPIEEFDVPTESFGEYDKNMLKKGIAAYSDEELQKLIEDYTS